MSKLVSMPVLNVLRNIPPDYTDFATAYVSGQKDATFKMLQNNQVFQKVK